MDTNTDQAGRGLSRNANSLKSALAEPAGTNPKAACCFITVIVRQQTRWMIITASTVRMSPCPLHRT